MEAKEKTEIEEKKEELVMNLLDQEAKNTKGVDVDEFLDKLEEKNIVTTQNNEKIYVENGERIYEIITNDAGEITSIEYKEKGKITAPRIQKIEIISKTNKTVDIKVTGLRMENGTYFYYVSETKENFGDAVGNNSSRRIYIKYT